MSPVNIVDVTAIHRFDELRRQLQERGIHLYVTRPKQVVGRLFDVSWLAARREINAERIFPTLKSAVKAFQDRLREP